MQNPKNQLILERFALKSRNIEILRWFLLSGLCFLVDYLVGETLLNYYGRGCVTSRFLAWLIIEADILRSAIGRFVEDFSNDYYIYQYFASTEGLLAQ